MLPVPRPLRAAAAAVATALVVAGCGGATSGQPEAGVTAAAPPTLTGVLAQNREDEVKGQAVIRLTAAGPGLTVTSLRLDWPGLAPVPPAAPAYPLAVGVPADLPVAYGSAVCTADPGGAPSASSSPPDVAPVAVASVNGAGAAPVEVRVPLDDSGSRALAARLFASSCGAQATAAAVDVSFGDGWRPATANGVPALAGTLVLTRRAATGDVSITGLDGSVLMALLPVTTSVPLLRLPAGAGQVVMPVLVATSGRCDGHALGEAKKTYVLTAQVDIGDGTSRPVALSPDPVVRPRMYRTILAGCAVRGG